MSVEIFRPQHQPARAIYDAFQEAAKDRKHSVEAWIKRERLAVWRAARDYAQQHGVRVPTLEQVEAAERQAYGHVDYGAKWAYGVAELLTTQEAIDCAEDNAPE